MAPILPKADVGLVLSDNAISEKIAKRLGHMYDEILKTVERTSILPQLVKGYQMTKEDGLQMTIYDKTQVIAYRKPEGAETDEQKPEVEEIITVRLEQWETRIGITDEAMIDSGEVNMSASERQNMGRSALAFKNAIDSEGLSTIFGGKTPVGATATWNLITDIQLSNDISTAVNAIERRGFNADKIVLTNLQWNRLNDTNWVIQGRTASDYLQERWGLTPVRSQRIGYDDMAGAAVWLFNPTGSCVVLDSGHTALFCQKPMTVEMERIVSRGIFESYWRKYFRTAVVDTDAMFVYNGIGY